jgi:hypothetical protein
MSGHFQPTSASRFLLDVFLYPVLSSLDRLADSRPVLSRSSSVSRRLACCGGIRRKGRGGIRSTVFVVIFAADAPVAVSLRALRPRSRTGAGLKPSRSALLPRRDAQTAFRIVGTVFVWSRFEGRSKLGTLLRIRRRSVS